MASHLAEFGWQPTVLTVDSRHYEESNDERLLDLLPKHLQVERTGALPARWCRPAGFGDVSLRAQWAMRSRVRKLVAQPGADLIFATVLPGYTSLVGAWAKARFNLSFVLDYQDPWVSDWGTRQPRFSKSGLAHWLATLLEPPAVRAANALTAVSGETLRTIRERKLIGPEVPVEIIPIGADLNDHATANRSGRSWIQRKTDDFVLVYTGTIIEGMLPSVRTLFHAVRTLQNEAPAKQVRIHFMGTSAQPNGRDSLGLERIAIETGVADWFRLEPRRIGYLDALRSMHDADVLLMLGSRDPHYTASKLFPCWLAGKPVLGLFHEDSSVNTLAHELGGVLVVRYGAVAGAETQTTALVEALRDLMRRGANALPPRNQTAIGPYSARGVAQKYAALFDRIVANPPVKS